MALWCYSDFRVATQNACIYSCRRNTQGWMHLCTYQTLRWNAAGSCWLTRTFPITHNKRANGAERSICSLSCVCYISYEMSGIQGHRIQQSNCLATVLKKKWVREDHLRHQKYEILCGFQQLSQLKWLITSLHNFLPAWSNWQELEEEISPSLRKSQGKSQTHNMTCLTLHL